MTTCQIYFNNKNNKNTHLTKLLNGLSQVLSPLALLTFGAR